MTAVFSTDKASRVDVVGVDGCKAGWYAVKKEAESGIVITQVFARFETLARWAPAPAIIAIDMPIGLSSVGKRAADIAARKLLDRRRKSSVFSTPVRQTLGLQNYAAACEANRSVTSSSLSQQAFHILPKIKELDDHLAQSQADATRVFEVHPELSFMLLQLQQGGAAGGVIEPKREVAGHAIRKTLLKAVFGEDIEKALNGRVPKEAARDDVLDAFAALWSAQRIANASACTVLEKDDLDNLGLKMNVRY